MSRLHTYKDDNGDLNFEWIFDDARFYFSFPEQEDEKPFWGYVSKSDQYHTGYFDYDEMAKLFDVLRNWVE